MSPRALENIELMLSCFELAQRTSHQKSRRIYLLIWPKSYVMKTISANLVKLKAYIYLGEINRRDLLLGESMLTL